MISNRIKTLNVNCRPTGSFRGTLIPSSGAALAAGWENAGRVL